MSFLGLTVEVELLMYAAAGLLAGWLVALAAVPAIHRRAVRLAMKRLETAVPASVRELRSDRDALRADFAVSTHRLEAGIAALRHKTVAHVTELTKKTGVIERLTEQLCERAARIEALEANERTLAGRERSMLEQLAACQAEVARLTEALSRAELARADLALEQHRLASVLEERTRQAHGYEIDLVTLQSQVDAVCLRVFDLANIVRTCDSREALDRALLTLVPGDGERPPAGDKSPAGGVAEAGRPRGARVQAAE